MHNINTNMLPKCTKEMLQCLLYSFSKVAQKVKIVIPTEKTKFIVISKRPTPCKLVNNNEAPVQVMKFNYIGAQITSNRFLIETVM